MTHLLLIREGARIFASSLGRRLFGGRRYEGDAAEICDQIVGALFDRERRFFRTSRASYPGFWSRDFGRSAPALLDLGFETEVGDTLRFALGHLERAGGFALALTPSGRPFDFPGRTYAPDGFAFLLEALVALDDAGLVRRHRPFLAREARRFFDLVVDPRTGLARRGVHFSEAQDYAIRDGSCYSSAMCFVVQRALRRLGIASPISLYEYGRLIPEAYLEDDRFHDDARRNGRISGDAAIAPFWSGALGYGDGARALFARIVARMDADGLNTPFPSRYGVGRPARGGAIRLERLNPWQRDAVWPCLGLQLIEALEAYRHPGLEGALAAIARLVETNGCLPEVVDARGGRPFRSAIYVAEDSMLWAANLAAALRRRDRRTDFTRSSRGGQAAVAFAGNDAHG